MLTCQLSIESGDRWVIADLPLDLPVVEARIADSRLLMGQPLIRVPNSEIAAHRSPAPFVRRTPGISCERPICSTLVSFIPLFCGSCAREAPAFLATRARAIVRASALGHRQLLRFPEHRRRHPAWKRLPPSAMGAAPSVLAPDLGQLVSSESGRKLDEGRPNAPVDVRHFALHQLADQHLWAVADRLSCVEDLLALRVAPPAASNPTACNRLSENRDVGLAQPEARPPCRSTNAIASFGLMPLGQSSSRRPPRLVRPTDSVVSAGADAGVERTAKARARLRKRPVGLNRVLRKVWGFYARMICAEGQGGRAEAHGCVAWPLRPGRDA